MATLLSKLADGLIERFEGWRSRERAYRELASLDDRSLADIGLSRADIPFVLDQKTTQCGASRIEPVNENNRVRSAA